jgi:hypothetical protein
MGVESRTTHPGRFEMSRTRYPVRRLLASTALLFGVIATHSYAINLDDAFAVWLLDEGSGDTAVDSSPQGNDGVITGAEWTDGKFGGGLQFDDTDVIVNVAVNGVGDEVISEVLWVKFDDFDIEHMFGYIHAADTGSARFYYFSTWINGGPPHSGVHMGVLDAGGNWGRGMAIPQQFDEDQWYHVAGVADGVGGSHKVYIDGTLVSDTGFAAGELIGTPGVLSVGTVPNEGKGIHGVIDEVAFFNIPLTEEDVNDLMTEGMAGAAAVQLRGKLPLTWSSLKR